jgi:putative polyhydroxyalkanoate system protein
MEVKMAKVDIKRKHALEFEIVKTKVNKLMDDLSDKYKLKCTWKNDKLLDVKGTGVKKGQVSLNDDNVHIEITLGMLASALKGKIESKINQYLDENL